MVSTVRRQYIHWSVEWKPLGDTRRKLALVLQFFVDQEIFPLGRVLRIYWWFLDRCQSPACGFRQRQLHSFAPLINGYLRNLCLQSFLGGLAQDSSGLAVRIAINLAARRIRRVAIDTSE